MKTIHAPFKGFVKALSPHGSITQLFGENPHLYSRFPINGVTTPDGRIIRLIGHPGIDFVAPWGTPLLAPEDGRIVEQKDSPEGYGLYVRIMTKDNVEWTYGHLSSFAKKLGDRVYAGDVVGYMGNTGFVTSSHDGEGFWRGGSNKYFGTHVHVGKRVYKGSMPIGYFDNGFLGSVDFFEQLPEDGITEEMKKDNAFEQGMSLFHSMIWILKKIGVKIN